MAWIRMIRIGCSKESLQSEVIRIHLAGEFPAISLQGGAIQNHPGGAHFVLHVQQ
jgi:hypothetical protein